MPFISIHELILQCAHISVRCHYGLVLIHYRTFMYVVTQFNDLIK